jgi:hypothetical protein
MIYYQFRAGRARRRLRRIDEQVAKAAKAVAGLAPVKRNRFIALDGAKSINRKLEARARDLVGLKGYVPNLAACPDGTPVTAARPGLRDRPTAGGLDLPLEQVPHLTATAQPDTEVVRHSLGRKHHVNGSDSVSGTYRHRSRVRDNFSRSASSACSPAASPARGGG